MSEVNRTIFFPAPGGRRNPRLSVGNAEIFRPRLPRAAIDSGLKKPLRKQPNFPKLLLINAKCVYIE
jgi:hypothetical protein